MLTKDTFCFCINLSKLLGKNLHCWLCRLSLIDYVSEFDSTSWRCIWITQTHRRIVEIPDRGGRIFHRIPCVFASRNLRFAAFSLPLPLRCLKRFAKSSCG